MSPARSTTIRPTGSVSMTWRSSSWPARTSSSLRTRAVMSNAMPPTPITVPAGARNGSALRRPPRRPIVDLEATRLARECPAAPLQHALAVGGLREQLRDRLAHDGGVGRECRPRVPHDAQLAIGHAGPGGNLLGEEAQPRLGVLQLADVDHRAHGALGPPVGVALDGAARGHPGPGAVLAAEAVLARPAGGTAADRLGGGLLHAREVVGVDALAPPAQVARRLIVGVAENRLEIPVPAQPVAVQVSFPGGFEGDTGEQPLARLTPDWGGRDPRVRGGG